MPAGALKAATEPNLPKTLAELELANGQEVTVIDCKRNPINLKLNFTA